MRGHLTDVINPAKFYLNRLRRFDSVGGRIFRFPIGLLATDTKPIAVNISTRVNIFFGARSLSSLTAKVLHMMGNVLDSIILVQNFGALPEKKFGAKTCTIWHDFGRLQTSMAK